MFLSSVKTAIKAGYRLIDTAFFYANEKDIGVGILVFFYIIII
jgi:diketogulonate reductase-like aldo/keto reductase